MKNPFKMIGSYIGLIIGTIVGYFSFAIIFSMAEQGTFKNYMLLLPITILISGFLIGWLINLLIIRLLK